MEPDIRGGDFHPRHIPATFDELSTAYYGSPDYARIIEDANKDRPTWMDLYIPELDFTRGETHD